MRICTICEDEVESVVFLKMQDSKLKEAKAEFELCKDCFVDINNYIDKLALRKSKK